ncbi:hypothetical protein GRI89_09380 [Altererythrobacter salegens]|uniref:SnoaL-like domain-containing protein n=1 Tax=Croceibacterium salegens TaxID=1737568 RepID=A0A6I4SWN1_9SPHN|nr:nuclear transport factor 2 family protein [Croceibacterium salegens]MXO59749.1 hypothetical protein [Croceibacterium salegens]
MDKARMLQTIDAIYAARKKRDVPGMLALMADGATFRFAGEGAMEGAFATSGAMPFHEAISSLDSTVDMTGVENVTTLVDGNRVAAIWNCDVRFPGREAFTTQIFNLWTFAEDGRISDLTEFVDTAKLAGELAAVGAGVQLEPDMASEAEPG